MQESTKILIRWGMSCSGNLYVSREEDVIWGTNGHEWRYKKRNSKYKHFYIENGKKIVTSRNWD